MICDKLCLMWKKEQALTTVDSKDEVLGHRLPVALNEQDGGPTLRWRLITVVIPLAVEELQEALVI